MVGLLFMLVTSSVETRMGEKDDTHGVECR
jgi:hypothetical protein